MATRKQIISAERFNPEDLPFIFDISVKNAKSIHKKAGLVTLTDKKTNEQYIPGADIFRLIMSRNETERWNWLARVIQWIDNTEKFFHLYRNQRHVDRRFPIDVKDDVVKKIMRGD